MSVEFFLARRLFFSRSSEAKRVSSPAIRVAMAGVSIGLMAMILSVCIVVGFKNQVRDKVVGFGSHIQLTGGASSVYESVPVDVTDSLLNLIGKTSGVVHVQRFVTAPGVLKTDNDFQGVVLKGVDSNYDWNFLRNNLSEGTIPDSSKNSDILISRFVADKLRLHVGDAFQVYFIKQSGVKVRKFKISGIYETHLEEYDKLFAFTALRAVQKVNDWQETEYSGAEIAVADFSRLDAVKLNIISEVTKYAERAGGYFYVTSIREVSPSIFNWLDLLDMNAVVIIVLMLIVSGVTMISGLLILILEHTSLIGLLKALGARGRSVRKVFLYFALFIILRGMLWGNIIALALCFVQAKFGLVNLDASVYYLSHVPVDINWWYIVGLNVGTLLITLAMMIVPSHLVARISPAQSMRYE